MANTLFGTMGGAGLGNPIIAQFKQFMKQMQGKNPQEEINKLLQSGKLTQSQLDQIQRQAMSMQEMFKGLM